MNLPFELNSETIKGGGRFCSNQNWKTECKIEQECKEIERKKEGKKEEYWKENFKNEKF